VDAWCKTFSAAVMLWPILRIGSLSEIGPPGTQPQITYPQSGSMVKFLIDRAGWDKFLAAYRALGDEKKVRSREAAIEIFQQQFGMDPFAMEREWLKALSESSVRPVPDDTLRSIQKDLRKSNNATK